MQSAFYPNETRGLQLGGPSPSARLGMTIWGISDGVDYARPWLSQNFFSNSGTENSVIGTFSLLGKLTTASQVDQRERSSHDHLPWHALCVRLRRLHAKTTNLMRSPFFSLLFVALFTAATIHAQTPAPSPTVDELVAKNLEAKGGAAALQAIQSVRFEGRLLANQGQLELKNTETKKRPSKIRTDAVLQGMTLVQSYNGNSGWKIYPFQGRKDPEKMSADESKSLVEEAEIGGPLENWKEQGKTVTYLGTEDVEGTAAHKLKVTRKNGDISYVYLDPDYFLEIRILDQRTEQGAKVEVETDLGDYEKVNGVYFPFSIETGSKGSTDKQKAIIEKGEANTPVDDSIFEFPVKAAK